MPPNFKQSLKYLLDDKNIDKDDFFEKIADIKMVEEIHAPIFYKEVKDILKPVMDKYQP